MKYLHSGLRAKLTEELVKNSPLLGRDATWTKTSALSRLPAYLAITIVRFHYKEKEKVRSDFKGLLKVPSIYLDLQINAKIMKDIKFPFALDLIDMCSPTLKAKMAPHRDLVQREENRKLERLARIKCEFR